MQTKAKLISTLVMCAFLGDAAAAAKADPLAPTARWSAYSIGRADTPPMG